MCASTPTLRRNEAAAQAVQGSEYHVINAI